MFLRHMWKHQNICNIFIGHILSNETGVKYIVCLTSNIYKRCYPNPKRAMLFNLPLLYAAVAIEEDRLNYDTVMRMFKSLLTLEGRRRRAGCLFWHVRIACRRYSLTQGIVLTFNTIN